MHQACDPCRIFAPSFEIAANSYAAVAEPNRLYFASLDYKRGAEVFSKVLTLFSACLHDAAACSHWCGCAAETVVGSRHPPLPADAGQTVHAGLPSRHVQIREIRPFAVRLFSPLFLPPPFSRFLRGVSHLSFVFVVPVSKRRISFVGSNRLSAAKFRLSSHSTLANFSHLSFLRRSPFPCGTFSGGAFWSSQSIGSRGRSLHWYAHYKGTPFPMKWWWRWGMCAYMEE